MYFDNLLLHRQALVLSCSLLVFLSANAVFAQQRVGGTGVAGVAGAAGAAGGTEVRIRDLSKLGRASLVRTPEYSSNVNRLASGSRRKEWAVFTVDYATAPEWIDELVFSFYVMTQNAQKEFNYFETTVTYVDIAKGDHQACVVLPPAAVARYGEPIAFGVEIVSGGQRAATKSEGSAEEWWKLITDKPNINKRPGYLVDRSKTPFAWAFVDDYEVVR